jgi:hypothetical protein
MANMSFGTGNSSYYDLARRQQVFSALAIATAPVIWSTAAGTGGPLLWNNTAAAGTGPRVLAVILGVSVTITVASTAGAGLGLTGGIGQTAAPTTTTAIDGAVNTNIGGPLPQCNLYRKGTVANAGNFFMPTHSLDTGALTVGSLGNTWVDLGGSVIVPPGSWVAVAAAATATAAVLQIGLMWAEIPY